MLVTHSLTNWLTDWLLFSKLDWCDSGLWRCQLKTCWGFYCCWCWWWGWCWQQFVADSPQLNCSISPLLKAALTPSNLPRLHVEKSDIFLSWSLWVTVLLKQKAKKHLKVSSGFQKLFFHCLISISFLPFAKKGRSANGWCLSDHWQFSSLSPDNLLSPPCLW